jgi:APA family basic amino acid/polyamine antiporter
VNQALTSQSRAADRRASHTLARSLRERDLLLLFVGSVIGSGIFLTPGLILRQLSGSVGSALMVWLVGGILSLLGALTYAELAAANPEAGGLYCYIRDGFGRLPAFLYGWSLFLVIASATIAALAHAFTTYLQEILPLSAKQSSAVVLLVIVVVTAVNIWGTRKSSDVQNLTTLIKVGIVLVLGIILLALGLWQGKHVREIPPAMGSRLSEYALFSAFGLAMITVLWAYEGWQFGTYSAGEVIEPQKCFPRAFLYGSLILAGLYLFAVIAYLVALGPEAAMESEAIAATAARAVLGSWAGKLVAGAILVSTFSAANSVMLTAPRVFFAMSNDNLFFRKLAEVHPRYGTPAAAVLALGVWSAVLAMVGEFAKLTNGAIFIGWIFYGLAAAAIFPIRQTNSAAELPYRVPGYPFTPLVFVLAAAAIVGNAIYAAVADPRQFTYLLVALGLMLLGLPGYFFWSRRQPSDSS